MISIYEIFSLLGGIALFLFGMNMMSDGLEKVAGSKMRSILQSITKNRFIATLVGIVITAVIQSSNAVTATMVSFVNAGLIELSNTVGVIFGANIGTSITGQLMAFSFEKFAPLIVALSAICYLFLKKDLVKKWAYVILGFGVLFLGMGMMKSAMGSLAQDPAITNAIKNTSNPFLLLFIGFAVTAIIQSNSAMTGILIGMAASGLISVDMCFYVILGSNIGCCISALLASVNGNRDSKRTALIHLLFNVIGTVVIFVILVFFKQPVIDFIYMLSPGATEAEQATRAVAMTNTVFRVFNVLIMFPFAGGLVKLTRAILPVKDHSHDVEDYTKLKYVGDNALTSPSTALIGAQKEIDRMADLTLQNIKMSTDVLINGDTKHIAHIHENEGYVDELTWQLQEFMVEVTQMKIPVSEEYKIGGFFHTIIDIERICDHTENFTEFYENMKKDGITFSDTAKDELRNMTGLVIENFCEALRIFRENDLSALEEFARKEQMIDLLSDKYQNNHFERMTAGSCSPKSGMVFTDILTNLERIGDHADNIAFALAPAKLEEELEEKAIAEMPELK